jgi:hypothetical protein
MTNGGQTYADDLKFPIDGTEDYSRGFLLRRCYCAYTERLFDVGEC